MAYNTSVLVIGIPNRLISLEIKIGNKNIEERVIGDIASGKMWDFIPVRDIDESLMSDDEREAKSCQADYYTYNLTEALFFENYFTDFENNLVKAMKISQSAVDKFEEIYNGPDLTEHNTRFQDFLDSLGE